MIHTAHFCMFVELLQFPVKIWCFFSVAVTKYAGKAETLPIAITRLNISEFKGPIQHKFTG